MGFFWCIVFLFGGLVFFWGFLLSINRGAFVQDWKYCSKTQGITHQRLPRQVLVKATMSLAGSQDLQEAPAQSFNSKAEGSLSSLLDGTFASQQTALPIKANTFELVFSLKCYFLFLWSRRALCGWAWHSPSDGCSSFFKCLVHAQFCSFSK